MSAQADDFLNSRANLEFERLTNGFDFEFWLFKCRVDGGRLIQAGVV